MAFTRFLLSACLAASLASGFTQASSAQGYGADDDDDAPLAPIHRRHARDARASYPSRSDEDYSDPRAPIPYEPSLRSRDSALTSRSAPGGERALRSDEREMTKQLVAYATTQPVGTLVVDTRLRKLFYVMGGGQALQYGIGVGREGFAWKGQARVGRKAEWPAWIPPAEMIRRRPELPERMEGGIANPLGARALYLYQGNADTLFRIHGTNEPETIGQAVSSGCIRMLNADVVDLYTRIPVNTKVVVL